MRELRGSLQSLQGREERAVCVFRRLPPPSPLLSCASRPCHKSRAKIPCCVVLTTWRTCACASAMRLRREGGREEGRREGGLLAMGKVLCRGTKHLHGAAQRLRPAWLRQRGMNVCDYRAEKKSLQILLSSTQAGPGRNVKQEQEEISRNHVPRLFLGSVYIQ